MSPTRPSGPARLTRAELQQRTRERLIAAAEALFIERGVNGASVEQIAEHAGFSRGAFYSNFADKQSLVAALLMERTRREADEVGAIVLNPAATFPERMDALRAWHRERARTAHEWLILRTELWLHAVRTGDRALLEQIEERERFARQMLAEGVATAFDAGTMPPADPAFLGLIMHALEDGLLIQHLIAPEGTSDTVVVDAVELLIRAWRSLAASSSGEKGRPA
ncbi:MAG: TetR/AcrR family transcriptional regulator [Thermomicrobiales bacterium]